MFIYRLLTSLLFIIFYPIIYLVFLSHNFKDRVSFRNYQINNSIWIHTASIGEVKAVTPLLKQLLEKYNSDSFVLTCMTKTGLSIAKEISGKLIVQQFPFDVPFIMKRFFHSIKPKLIILVETELWPNMLWKANKLNIPVIMINARLSHKSFNRFRLFKWFLRHEFANIKLICAQSEKEKIKFEKLKFRNVINANNLKFVLELPNHEIHELRHAWNIKFNDFVIAFGCTRPGEEEMIKKIYEKIYQLIPRLKIIIAPRHIGRVQSVQALFNKKDYLLFSSPKSTSYEEEKRSDSPFIIIDELGVLSQVYALSDIVIIGGSFYKFGGHNPLEAIWYEKAVIMGPYHSSCIGTVEKLLIEEGIMISNENKLAHDIMTLYENIDHRIAIGKKAKAILLANQDAIKLHLNAINKFIL